MGQTITASFGLDINPLKAGWNRAASLSTAAARGIGNRITSLITSPLTAIGAAVGGFLTYQTFKSGIQGIIESGSELQKLHKQTGIAVGSLATLKGIFKQADVSADGLGASVGKMQRNLFQAAHAGSPAGEALRMLHLDIASLIKLRPEEEFVSIGKAIAAMPSPIERAATAMALFGRSGAELLPVFEEMDNVDFGSLSEKAAMLEKDSEKFHQITVGFRQAGAQLQGVFLGMADSLAPSLIVITKLLSQKNAIRFGSALGDGIKAATEVLFGAFRDPMALGDLVANAVLWGYAKAGNFLVNNLLRATIFFSENLLIGIDVASRALSAGMGVAVDHFKFGIDVIHAGLITAAGSFVATILAGLIGAGKFLKQDTMGLEGVLVGVNATAKALSDGVLSQIKTPRTFNQSFAQQPITGAGKMALMSMRSGAAPDTKFFNDDRYARGMSKNLTHLQALGQAVLAPAAAPAMSNQITHFTPMNGGLQTGHLQTGHLQTFGLQGGAYHSIHSGDSARKKAEAEKMKNGGDPTEKRFGQLMSFLKEALGDGN